MKEEVTMYSISNQKVRFDYLSENNVAVSVMNQYGEYEKITSENLPVELKKLNSKEIFYSFLNSSYVRTNTKSDGNTVVYVNQKLLGGMFNNKGGGMRDNNADGAFQAGHTGDAHATGHGSSTKGGEASGKGDNQGYGAGIGAGVSATGGGRSAGNVNANTGQQGDAAGAFDAQVGYDKASKLGNPRWS